MERKNKIIHPNLVVSVLFLLTFSLICTPTSAKKYLTSTMKKNVTISKDTKLDVILPYGILISGRVTDSKGNPLEDVDVTAYPDNPLLQSSVITDKKGDYKLSLSKDIYHFEFEPNSSESRAVPKNIEDVDIKLKRKLNVMLNDGFFLSGMLLNFQGKPAGESEIYAESLSDDRHFVFSPNPFNGQFRGALPAGKYKVTAIRNSFNDLTSFSPHTNKKSGKKNILKDTQIKNIKMPKGVVLQGTVKDQNNQMITVIITFLNTKDLKAKTSWVRDQTGRNFSLDSIYKAALTKGTYILHVMPIHIEGKNFNTVNTRATHKIIDNVKIKKDKTLNIILEDGYILSGMVKDKKGNVVKNAPIFISDLKSVDDFYSGKKIIVLTFTDSQGKYSYPLPEGKYDIYFYSPDLFQDTIETSTSWIELDSETKKIQDYFMRVLRGLSKNSKSGSVRK